MQDVEHLPAVGAARLRSNLFSEGLNVAVDGRSALALQTLGSDDDDGRLGRRESLEERVRAVGQLGEDVGGVAQVLRSI